MYFMCFVGFSSIVWIAKINNNNLFLGLLQRLEEETNVNTYIVKQKLPKEIDTKHKEVDILQLVLSEPAMGRAELDALNTKVI